MDDQSLPEQEPISTSTPPEKSADLSGITAEDSNAILTDILKSAASRAGGPIEAAVEEFLGGKGELLESTRSSLSRGKTAAKKEINAFLIEKFNLAPAVAKVIASLLIKLVPQLGELIGEKEKSAVKKKAAKSKKKTASTTKKKAAKKKTAKHTTAKQKAKSTAAKKNTKSTGKAKKK